MKPIVKFTGKRKVPNPKLLGNFNGDFQFFKVVLILFNIFLLASITFLVVWFLWFLY